VKSVCILLVSYLLFPFARELHPDLESPHPTDEQFNICPNITLAITKPGTRGCRIGGYISRSRSIGSCRSSFNHINVFSFVEQKNLNSISSRVRVSSKE